MPVVTVSNPIAGGAPEPRAGAREAGLRLLLASAAVLMPGACDRTPDELPRSLAAEAELRWHGREMYKSLLTPSCGAPPGFRRADRLRREQAAVAAFEKRAAGTPLGSHLALARSDAAYGLAVDGGCWSDEDIRFAERHVEMTKASVKAGLARMRSLAASVEAPAGAGALSADRGAEFRSLVRAAVRVSRFPCPLATEAGNDEILAPARAELARFEARLAGTPYAAQFDFAEADSAFEESITVVECAEPSASSPADAGRAALADMKRRIAALETKIRRG